MMSAMNHYLLEYRYVDMDARARVRPDHLAYLGRLHEEGSVLMAGPLADSSGAVMVLRADDEAAAQGLVDADPYTREGVAAGHILREWTVVVPGQA